MHICCVLQSPSTPALAPLDNAFVIPAEQLEIGPIIAMGGQGQACMFGFEWILLYTHLGVYCLRVFLCVEVIHNVFLDS